MGYKPQKTGGMFNLWNYWYFHQNPAYWSHKARTKEKLQIRNTNLKIKLVFSSRGKDNSLHNWKTHPSNWQLKRKFWIWLKNNSIDFGKNQRLHFRLSNTIYKQWKVGSNVNWWTREESYFRKQKCFLLLCMSRWGFPPPGFSNKWTGGLCLKTNLLNSKTKMIAFYFGKMGFCDLIFCLNL